MKSATKQDGVTFTESQKATIREIMKARRVAGSVVVSLPNSVREPLNIIDGDRLMIAVDQDNHCLIITKE